VMRALEVHALSGKTQTELHRSHRRDAPMVRWLAIDIPRERLYARIQDRTAVIFPGLIAEARHLDQIGASRSPAARALGISEGLRQLRGELAPAEALAAAIVATRRYAKRQLTWFRAVESIRWLPEGELDPAALARELATR
jgi:tRNA dimethylallyltransferase